MFELSPGNWSAFVELVCINDPSNGPPIWDPPIDGNIIPFPDCVRMRKLLSAAELGVIA